MNCNDIRYGNSNALSPDTHARMLPAHLRISNAFQPQRVAVTLSYWPLEMMTATENRTICFFSSSACADQTFIVSACRLGGLISIPAAGFRTLGPRLLLS